MEAARQVLRDVFGFTDLYPTQEQVVRRLLVDEESAALVLPTGGGKSLCFQLPALCLPGLTLVVSPLISLMKDQVDVLRSKNVKVASMDSSLSQDEMDAARQGIRDGSLKILYVAPERLNNENWVKQMRDVDISLLAIDEAHCISAWGTNFRPDYLKVSRFAQEMGIERVLALTATATPEVARDMCRSFNIDQEYGLFMTSPYRPNLHITVEACKSIPAKMNRLVPLLRARTGPVICYVTRQIDAQLIVDLLKDTNIEAHCYHAGIQTEKRKEVQDAFLHGEKEIVVATIAFGMGIECVREIPKNIEGWSQEIGRAGRDGNVAECLMLLSDLDLPTLEGFARGDTPSLKAVRDWLAEIASARPKDDGCIDFSEYDQGKAYDLRPIVLKMMFARLELKYGFLRAVTPMYQKYDIEMISSNGLSRILADTSAGAQLIRAHWKKGTKYYGINIPDAAKPQDGLRRADLVGIISGWERNGFCRTKPAKVRSRFKVLEQLPADTSEMLSLADQLHKDMVDKENEEVERLRSVVRLATATKCFWHAICTYFGHPNSVPNGRCETCSYCKTGAAVSLPITEKRAAIPSEEKLEAALLACDDRDDPRLLARFVFGISSPRITALKLSKHPLFGSLSSCDFKLILDFFEKACEKATGNEGTAAASQKRIANGDNGGPKTKKTRH